MKQEIEFIIKCNGSLAEKKINRIEQLLSKYKHGSMILMNVKNSKKNEPHESVLKLSQKLDLGCGMNMLLFKTYQFIAHGKL